MKRKLNCFFNIPFLPTHNLLDLNFVCVNENFALSKCYDPGYQLQFLTTTVSLNIFYPLSLSLPFSNLRHPLSIYFILHPASAQLAKLSKLRISFSASNWNPKNCFEQNSADWLKSISDFTTYYYSTSSKWSLSIDCNS